MPKSKNYEELTSELHETLDKLQSTELGVDEAVKLYERGMAVAKELETFLKQAENKIKKIHKV